MKINPDHKMLWIIPGGEGDLKWPHIRLRHYNVCQELGKRLKADILFGVMGTPTKDLISFVKRYDIVVHMNHSQKDLDMLNAIKGHTVSLRDHCENLFNFPMQKECFEAADAVVCCSGGLKQATNDMYKVNTELIPDMYERTLPIKPPTDKTDDLFVVCMSSGAGAAIFYNSWAPIFESAGYTAKLITDRTDLYPGAIAWDPNTWEKIYAEADVVCCPQDPSQYPHKSSVKLVQAFAHGKPCISSHVRSYMEATFHGENGFIAKEIQGVESLAYELKDPAVRQRIHVEAIRSSEMYSPTAIAEMWYQAGVSRL